MIQHFVFASWPQPLYTSLAKIPQQQPPTQIGILQSIGHRSLSADIQRSAGGLKKGRPDDANARLFNLLFNSPSLKPWVLICCLGIFAVSVFNSMLGCSHGKSSTATKPGTLVRQGGSCNQHHRTHCVTSSRVVHCGCTWSLKDTVSTCSLMQFAAIWRLSWPQPQRPQMLHESQRLA